MVHLLFEQSGTFRDEFKALGFDAKDYDIQNEYGRTDIICDIFEEIRHAYNNTPSILDQIGGGEYVFAFFPCTQFETQKTMWFRGVNCSQRNWSDVQKVEYAMRLHKTLHEYYELVCMLVLLAIKRGWKFVVENPHSEDHYLRRYFPIPATLVDKDRTRDGDYFTKPTAFWFVGFKPQCNLVMEPLKIVKKRQVEKLRPNSKERSEISPQYARRFIKQYIIDEDL